MAKHIDAYVTVSDCLDPVYPACTSKKTGVMAGRTYPYDCAECENCRESIRLLKIRASRMVDERERQSQVMPLLRTVLLLLLVLPLGACATIMNGSRQKIGFSSTPAGAMVSVDGKDVGVTPLFVELERDTEHVVSIQKEGYERHDATLVTSVSGWVWGNILLGGFIGLGVDAITGGLYNLDPPHVGAQMRTEPAHAVAQESSSGSSISSTSGSR